MKSRSSIRDLLKGWTDKVNEFGIEGEIVISFEVPLRITHRDGRVFETTLPIMLTKNGAEVLHRKQELKRIGTEAIEFFNS